MNLADMPAKLEDLKQRLLNEKDFSKTANYFLDLFGEDDSFMQYGKHARCELLETLITPSLSQMLGKNVAKIAEMQLVRATDSDFYHGGLSAGKAMGFVFFFEDVRCGMIVLNLPNDPETKFTRFSADMLD